MQDVESRGLGNSSAYICCFLSIVPYPQAFPVREVSCQSPFTFTEEGTECQPARAVPGLLPGGRRGQQPRGTCMRTENRVTETPSLVLG